MTTYTVNANGKGPLPSLDLERPDLDNVVTLLRDAKGYYTGFHENCREEEEYYFGRVSVPVVEGYDSTRPATASAIINIATAHVDTGNMFVDVPLASPRAKARAERLKKFYQGFWLNVRAPVLQTCTKHQFLYGIGWLKTMFAPEQWPDAPMLDDYGSDEEYRKALREFMERRALLFPFVVKNVNPRNLVWDDSRIRPRWAMEFYDRTAGDIKARYPEWSTSKKDQDMSEWVEYWDERWCGYLADNQWVWGPAEHSYGGLPYRAAIPGAAVDWDVGKPEDRYRGILRPVHDLLNSEARIVTAYEAILRKYAWGGVNFTGPKALVDEVRKEWDEFGDNWLPPSVTSEVRKQPVPPAELLGHLNIIQTMIEMATFPNVIRGVRPSGVSTGFGISVLAGMGRLVFQSVADGLARCVEETNGVTASIVEHRIMGRVTVHARSEVHSFDQTIGPEDIRGYYENVVRFKAEAPEERERESLLAMRLKEAGILSLYEAQRRSGVTNPLEEQMQQEAELLLQSPELRAAKLQIAMERLGLLQQMGEAVESEGSAPQETPFGNQFQGLGGEPRVGEAGIQRQRVASQQGRPSATNPAVFPQGMGGLDVLGSLLGAAPGGAAGMPSGQTVR